MGELASATDCEVVVKIGGKPALVRTDNPQFRHMLEDRYSGFVSLDAESIFSLDVELKPPGRITDQDEIAVSFTSGRWLIERSDLYAEWDPASRHGRIVQSANPYSIDAALRIIHSLILAREGGLLIHAASAVRNGKAFLFAGVSGAGKTTISRLAPGDVTLLSDEISYLRRNGHGYVAYGTPFTGELAKVGQNVRAPLAALFLLRQGPKNVIEPISLGNAARLLLKNVLFFAQESELVSMIFQSACDLVLQVPVYQLTFVRDARVWELIA
jgi:hypothetical protein